MASRVRLHPVAPDRGLWTTPSDLARYLIAAQKGWQTGEHPVLSAEMVRAMLTPGMGNVGLGPAMTEDGRRFGSSGSNEGFKNDMTAFVDGSVRAFALAGHRFEKAE